ncbi:hypothetical protein ACFQ21_05160 [Ohtaekwangia kribbensis]|uniref:Uncharacterized protein n=1 Tax=Ohtaekwangia kribbensis TaxID=688913 RepID=A0ABW3K113_9BACT
MLSRIKAILNSQAYEVYVKPYQLNIVGLRSKNTNANSFDDEIHVFYRTEKGDWNYRSYKATTDPGTFWLNNPSYSQGTAILAQGQYKDAYAIGLHRGKYEALRQVKPVTVIRDYNRDSLLDFNNGTEETGIFGINIHRAESNGTTKYIDKYSAGCQVFQNAGDFNQFMDLCERHKSLYGNSFTYTLIDFRAVRRITWKRVIAASAAAAAITLGFVISDLYND